MHGDAPHLRLCGFMVAVCGLRARHTVHRGVELGGAVSVGAGLKNDRLTAMEACGGHARIV